jgi:hypothetical protein
MGKKAAKKDTGDKAAPVIQEVLLFMPFWTEKQSSTSSFYGLITNYYNITYVYGLQEAHHKPLLLSSERDNWVVLDFRLLNWKYMNFEKKYKDDTHVFTIKVGKLICQHFID